MQLKQFIAPQECVEEIVDNGVTITNILSPEECNELLHPTPPDDEDDDTTPDSSHQHHTPTRPDEMNAPNTGWQQVMRDAVHESGIIPLLVAFVAILLIRAIRSSQHR